jgi:hypothetical protein
LPENGKRFSSVINEKIHLTFFWGGDSVGLEVFVMPFQMPRRSFVAVPLFHNALFGLQVPGALQSDKSFRVPVSPDEFLLSAIAAKQSLLLLAASKKPGMARLICTGTDGNVKWAWAPAQGHPYFDVLVRDTGTILLPYFVRSGREVGSYLDEVSAEGVFVRTVPLPTAPEMRELAVSADRVFAFSKDGAMVSKSLLDSSVRTSKSAHRLGETFRVYGISDRELMVVDRTDARVGWLQIESRDIEWIEIAAPEVRQSVNYFADALRRAPSSVPADSITRPPVVGAACIDSDFALYFLMQPVNRKNGASVFRIRRGKGVDRIYRIQIAANDVRPTLPHRIAVVGRSLFLVFGGGHVDHYALT